MNRAQILNGGRAPLPPPLATSCFQPKRRYAVRKQVYCVPKREAKFKSKRTQCTCRRGKDVFAGGRHLLHKNKQIAVTCMSMPRKAHVLKRWRGIETRYWKKNEKLIIANTKHCLHSFVCVRSSTVIVYKRSSCSEVMTWSWTSL